MSLKKLLPYALLASIIGSPATAQTTPSLAFLGDNTDVTFTNNGLVGGADFTSGPVPVWYLADLSSDLQSNDEQDFTLLISNLDLTANGTDSFWIDVTLAGARLASAVKGNEGAVIGSPQGRSADFDAPYAGEADDMAFRTKITPSAGDNWTDLGVRIPVLFDVDGPETGEGDAKTGDGNGCNNMLNDAAATATISIYTTDPGTGDTPDVTATTAYSGEAFTLIKCVDPLDIVLKKDEGDTKIAEKNSGFEAGVAGPQLDSDGDGTPETAADDTSRTATIGVIEVQFVGGDGATTPATVKPVPVYFSLADAAGDAGYQYDSLDDFSPIDLEITASPEAASGADLTLLSAQLSSGGSVALTDGTAEVSLVIPSGFTTGTRPIEGIQLAIDQTAASNDIAKFKGTKIDARVTSIADVDIADVTTYSAALDTLDAAMVFCGPFDWIQDSTGTANNTFRITGYGDSLTAVYGKIFNAEKYDGDDGDEKKLNVAEDMLEGMEIIIDSSHFSASDAFGNFGIADFSIGLEGVSSVGALDCDRIMFFADKANTLSSFGNDYAKATPFGIHKDGSD